MYKNVFFLPNCLIIYFQSSLNNVQLIGMYLEGGKYEGFYREEEIYNTGCIVGDYVLRISDFNLYNGPINQTIRATKCSTKCMVR